MPRPPQRPAAAGALPHAWLANLALASASAWLLALALRELGATDFGWQWRTGQLVLANGPPHVDVLSYTRAGQPWTEVRWLWCAAIAALYGAFGAPGVTLWAAALNASAFATALASRFRRSLVAPAAFVLALAALAASQRFMARPEAISHLLLAIMLALLDRHRRAPGRALIALVPLQILWTNTHSLFVLGPLLAGLAAALALPGALAGDAAGRRACTRLALLTAALVVACLVNPYGADVFAFAAKISSELHGGGNALIAELAPPLGAPAMGWAVLGWLVLTAWTAALLLIAGRRADPFLACAALAMSWLSFQAVRNLSLFALVAVPLTLQALDAIATSRPNLARGARRAAPALAALVAAATLAGAWSVVTDRFYVWQHDTNRFGIGLNPYRYPFEAGRVARDLAARATPPTHVFATLHTTSALMPLGVESFVDPRVELHGPGGIAASIRAEGDSAALSAAVRAHDIGVIVAMHADVALQQALVRRGDVQLVHTDALACVFVRPERVPGIPSIATAQGIEATAVALRSALPARPRSPGLFERAAAAAPYQNAGSTLTLFGRPDLARPFFEDAVACEPHSVPARLSLALAFESTRDRARARAQREYAVGMAPRDPEALTALALHDLEDRRIANATQLLERSVAASPAHARSWALLGEARRDASDLPEAIRCLERAVQLDPSNALYRRRLDVARGMR